MVYFRIFASYLNIYNVEGRKNETAYHRENSNPF